MMVDQILTLFDYNYWATGRVLGACEELSDDAFVAPNSLCRGSIRNTLVHVMSAEWVWRLRCQGESPTGLLDDAMFPTLRHLRARWRDEEQAMHSFLNGISDTDLSRPHEYRTTSGQPFTQPMWQILLHVINHGTQHRAEVAHALTELGHSPGDLDMSLYFRR
jgi:uncharacterized damage-inducible protein DinB